MLDADVDALLDVAVSDHFVDNDAHGGFSHVVDDARLSVVDLVRHTLLHSAVGFDVDNVSDSVEVDVVRTTIQTRAAWSLGQGELLVYS